MLLVFAGLAWVSAIPLQERAEGAQRERGREGRDKEEDARSLNELWRLYPLNPEAGEGPPAEAGEEPPAAAEEAPAPTPTTTPTLSPSATARAVDPPAARDATGTRTRDRTPWLVGLGAGAALLTIVGLLLRRRRAAPGELAPEVSARTAAVADAGGSPPQARVANAAGPAGVRGPVSSPKESDVVRVHLRDGRCVQGRLRGTAGRGGRVLLIDPETVHDRAGNELEVRSVDSFVPGSLIESVEHLAETGVHN
jgi:hypothetical protein